MAEQRINNLKISCLEILDNKEQNRGGKFISILCAVREGDISDLNGPAVLLPSGKFLTVRKIEKAGNGQCFAVLKGAHRTDLKKRNLIVPRSFAVSAGKEAFFLLPSSKDRLEKGNFFVSGGVFPQYNGESSRPSAAITFHGRVASVRFFHNFPLIPGAKYFISSEENRDLRTPVTLVYPGTLNQKEGARLSDRLLKFGGRPSLKAIYSIILRTDLAVELPDYLADEDFEGSIRSGRWAIMSREYERIKGALLKRTAAFGGVPEKEAADLIRGEKKVIHQVISDLVGNESLKRKEGYLINSERDKASSLSPMASKLLSDLKEEENGINLANISNPLFADTYKALGRLDLITVLSDDLALHNERFEQLKTELMDMLEIGDEIDLADVKEKLSVSRRILVPFLEELDREGYFQWKGDKRVVLKKD